jgi:hypothetical protein
MWVASSGFPTTGLSSPGDLRKAHRESQAPQAIILRGQTAWNRLKATAAEQRQLWREVGEALLEGRRLHPSNQAFGAWCKEQGFDDLSSQYRSAAMFLAKEWVTVSRITGNVSDPIQLQKNFNEQKAPKPSSRTPCGLPSNRLPTLGRRRTPLHYGPKGKIAKPPKP